MSEPGPTPETPETPKTGPNWTLILIIVAIVVAVILIIWTIVNRANGGDEVVDGGLPPVAARLTVEEPTNGAVLDVGTPFTVRGTGAGLPEGNLLVEAVDSAGNVLEVQPTTVTASDAGTGGAGPWSVQLTVNVAPGTPGTIRAYSTSPVDAAVLAEASIAVTFGETPSSPAAAVSIDIPMQGEIVGEQELVVVGQGSALPENHVLVRAVTDDGVLLAEQPTTVNADIGGTGEWRVTLGYSATPGTPGQITAESHSLVDGSVIASAVVDVQFGRSEQPMVSIASPQSGANVDPAQFDVGGTGTALPENNVVIRVLDTDGNVLAEQPTTVNADVGGTGQWSATLSIDPTFNGPGRIQAFSPSPADGSMIAQTEVGVSFTGSQPGQPAITITSPNDEEVVSATEIVVNGTGTALPENNVLVRALDAEGNVLAEQPTTVNADLGGTGPWSATLSVAVAAEGPGLIRAFSRSPVDGSMIAQAEVEIVYAGSPEEPEITITSPAAGAVLDSPDVNVNGTGTALPENNVVVRALDATGTVLAEQPTTVDSELGGSGPWSTTLTIAAPLEAPGTIQALSISPADGSVVAETEVGVTFSLVQTEQPTITITSPVDGEVVNAAEILVEGTGTALPENNVVVRAVSADGTVLAEQPTTVNAEVGGTGPWTVTLTVDTGDTEQGRIEAFATSPADGSVIAQSGVDVVYGRARD